MNKFLYFLIFFKFCFLVNSTDISNVDELISSVQPSRERPWIDKHNINKKFFEYFNSTKDNECFFTGLGYKSRQEAINALFNLLKQTNDKAQKAKNYIEKNKENAKDITEYLNNIKNNNSLTEFISHFDINQHLIKQDNMFNLVDALALEKEVNLYIYQPEIVYNKNTLNDKNIFLSHKYYAKSFTKSIYLIYKNGHFNILIPIDNDLENTHALQKEQRYLLELLDRIQSQQLETSIEDNHTEEDSLSIIERSYTDNDKKNIEKFITNYYQYRINGFNEEESCLRAYEYYSLMKESDIYAPFALVRLTLEKGYIPNKYTKKSYLKELIAQMDYIIKNDTSENRIKHYAKIFKGKLLVKLRLFKESYVLFLNLYNKDNNFTQTYVVDMAELILVYEYIPEGLNKKDAFNYAKALIENLPQPNKKNNNNNSSKTNDMFSQFKLNSSFMREKQSKINNIINECIKPPRSINHQSVRSKINELEKIKHKSDANQRKAKKRKPLVLHFSYDEEHESDSEELNNNSSINSSESNYNPFANLPEEIVVADSNPCKRRKPLVCSFSYDEEHESDSEELNNNSSSNSSEPDYNPFANLPEEEIVVFDKNHCKKRKLNQSQGAIEQDNIVLAKNLILKANELSKQRKDTEAIKKYRKALELLNDKEPVLIAESYLGLGNARDDDNPSKTRAYWFHKALELLTEKDTVILTKVYLGLGNAKDQKNPLNHSSYWYLLVIDLLECSECVHLLAQANYGLGNINRVENKLAKAKYYYEEALKYDNKYPLCEAALNVLNNY